MKIAVGGFFHESNTFNPIVTTEKDFVVFEGDAIYSQGESYLLAKGIVDYLGDIEDYQIVPLNFARAVPNGEIELDFYLSLKARFFELLAMEGSIDAFVLALHGSMRVQSIGSAESDLLKSIRGKYPDTPIICGLDMHATITKTMLETAQGLAGFKTAPHLDAWETGRQAARMADAMLREKAELYMAAVHIPALIAGEKAETDVSPMQELMDFTRALEAEPDVCTASVFLGFPWADSAENGVNCVVVCRSNLDTAQTYANQLADAFKANLHKFSFSGLALEPREAILQALQDTCQPVFISDSGDNPTAGSTGDNTSMIHLLNTLPEMAKSSKHILMAGIFDPNACEICKNHLDKEITLQVGGVFDRVYCKPESLSGCPLRLVESFGPFGSDLILFATRHFDLIITSKHIGFTGVEMFKALEIDYLNLDIIIVKLGYLTEDFKAISAKHYLALSRGCTDEVLDRLHYSNQEGLLRV